MGERRLTREKAIETLENVIKCIECDDFGVLCSECDYDAEDADLTEAMKVAIKALKSMDEDLIRRQDALNCFHAWIDKHGDVQEPDDMAEYRAIEELPSVMEGEE